MPRHKYSSNTKDVYSWEAEMLKTDDFKEASNELDDQIQVYEKERGQRSGPHKAE